jgi:hypothetical protein
MPSAVPSHHSRWWIDNDLVASCSARHWRTTGWEHYRSRMVSRTQVLASEDAHERLQCPNFLGRRRS